MTGNKKFAIGGLSKVHQQTLLAANVSQYFLNYRSIRLYICYTTDGVKGDGYGSGNNAGLYFPTALIVDSEL